MEILYHICPLSTLDICSGLHYNGDEIIHEPTKIIILLHKSEIYTDKNLDSHIFIFQLFRFKFDLAGDLAAFEGNVTSVQTVDIKTERDKNSL